MLRQDLLLATASEAPSDLVSPATLNTEIIGALPDKTGVLLEHAANEGNIEIVVLEVSVGLLAVGDATNSTNGHLVSNLVLDGLGERLLVSRAGMDVLLLVETSGRNVEKVYAPVGEDLGKLDGLVDGPALDTGFIKPVCRADAEDERHAVRDGLTCEVNDFESETGAVLEGSTVFVSTLVGCW